MSPDRQIQQLNEGIASLGHNPVDFPVKSYLAYLEELSRWNRTYNLTAVRDLDSMVSFHILDSLSILPFISGPRCLDVGSGAGLPGVVLALSRPDTDWVLVDSKIKKVRFLNHVLQRLDIMNVSIFHGRIEDYSPEEKFNFIVSRAFSDLKTFMAKAGHLRTNDGKLLAMKGKIQPEEINQLKNVEYHIQNLQIPGIKSERNLVIIN